METSKREIIFFVFIISLIFSGCVSVETKEEWQRITNFYVDKAGSQVLWQKTEDDERLIKEEIKNLLSDGLSMDDSIRIALINNKRLQAIFEELGIAKADLVQAGLLTNPDLTLIFRFPFGGGGTGIEAGGLFNLSDIWQIPLKKKIASLKLEIAIYQIQAEILNTVRDAKTAYIDYIFLYLMRDEMERFKDTVEEWRDHLLFREGFGFTSAIDIYMAEAVLAETELEFSKVESELLIARYRLNRILGLWDIQWETSVDLSILEKLPTLPGLEKLISHAISHRPDIQIAKKEVEEARRTLSLERARIFSNVQAGALYERGIDEEESMGPEIGIQIPIFDQNQAQISKAEYRLRRKEKALKAKIDEAREEISILYEKLIFLKEQIDSLKTKIIPVREKALEFAERYFNAMELNMLYLIEARKNLIATKKAYLNALKDYQKELEDIIRITGGFKYEGH